MSDLCGPDAKSVAYHWFISVKHEQFDNSTAILTQTELHNKKIRFSVNMCVPLGGRTMFTPFTSHTCSFLHEFNIYDIVALTPGGRSIDQSHRSQTMSGDSPHLRLTNEALCSYNGGSYHPAIHEGSSCCCVRTQTRKRTHIYNGALVKRYGEPLARTPAADFALTNLIFNINQFWLVEDIPMICPDRRCPRNNASFDEEPPVNSVIAAPDGPNGVEPANPVDSVIDARNDIPILQAEHFGLLSNIPLHSACDIFAQTCTYESVQHPTFELAFEHFESMYGPRLRVPIATKRECESLFNTVLSPLPDWTFLCANLTSREIPIDTNAHDVSCRFLLSRMCIRPFVEKHPWHVARKLLIHSFNRYYLDERGLDLENTSFLLVNHSVNYLNTDMTPAAPADARALLCKITSTLDQLFIDNIQGWVSRLRLLRWCRVGLDRKRGDQRACVPTLPKERISTCSMMSILNIKGMCNLLNEHNILWTNLMCYASMCTMNAFSYDCVNDIANNIRKTKINKNLIGLELTRCMTRTLPQKRRKFDVKQQDNHINEILERLYEFENIHMTPWDHVRRLIKSWFKGRCTFISIAHTLSVIKSRMNTKFIKKCKRKSFNRGKHPKPSDLITWGLIFGTSPTECPLKIKRFICTYGTTDAKFIMRSCRIQRIGGQLPQGQDRRNLCKLRISFGRVLNNLEFAIIEKLLASISCIDNCPIKIDRFWLYKHYELNAPPPPVSHIPAANKINKAKIDSYFNIRPQVVKHGLHISRPNQNVIPSSIHNYFKPLAVIDEDSSSEDEIPPMCDPPHLDNDTDVENEVGDPSSTHEKDGQVAIEWEDNTFDEFTIQSWNVRNLYNKCKEVEMIGIQWKSMIIAINESCENMFELFHGSGRFTNYEYLGSPYNKETHGSRGVGFLVHVSILSECSIVETGNANVACLRINTHGARDMYCITPYMHNKGTKPQKTRAICKCLDIMMKKCVDADAPFVLMGDLNTDVLKILDVDQKAKPGDNIYKALQPILLKYDLRCLNREFDDRLTYRRAFDKPLYSRLDFMFTHKLDVTSFRAPPINVSDHSPLFAKIRLQVDQTKIQKSSRTKIKYNLLTEDPEIRHKYKNILAIDLESVLETCDGTNVNAATNTVIHQINTKLEKSCGSSKIRTSGKKFWIDATFKALFDEKRRAAKRWKNCKTKRNWQHLKKMRNECKKCKKNNIRYKTAEIASKMEKFYKHNPRKMWGLLKSQWKSKESLHINSLKVNTKTKVDDPDNFVTIRGDQNICDAMRNHQEQIAIDCGKKQIDKNAFSADPPFVAHNLCAPFDTDEVDGVIRDLKCNKAAGPNDGLKTEFFKYGGDHMTTMMRALCNCYLRNGKVDIRLRTGCAIQLYKSKGARTKGHSMLFYFQYPCSPISLSLSFSKMKVKVTSGSRISRSNLIGK